jgi:hypothetical protein
LAVLAVLSVTDRSVPPTEQAYGRVSHARHLTDFAGAQM